MVLLFQVRFSAKGQNLKSANPSTNYRWASTAFFKDPQGLYRPWGLGVEAWPGSRHEIVLASGIPVPCLP